MFERQLTKEQSLPLLIALTHYIDTICRHHISKFDEEKYCVEKYNPKDFKYFGEPYKWILVISKDSVNGFHSIEDFYIDPRYRGLKLGSKIIEELKFYYNGLKLHVQSSNPRALKFWKNHGFKEAAIYNCDGFYSYELIWERN